MATDHQTTLRVKYGLAPGEPTDAQLADFVRYYEGFKQKGLTDDQAGEQAASRAFPSFRRWKYGSLNTQAVSDTVAQIRAALKSTKR